MELSDKRGVNRIVAALATFGVEDVIITPGSRNAPFIISFNRYGGFTCTSIKDERSAGFYALGKSIESQKPVVLCCTSGSAALNFAPAISESYYQRIPLIILTADRPKIWTDQADGQTINQTNVYDNFIRKSFELNGDATADQDLWYIERCVSEGMNTALKTNPGPIHFNVPVNEPLYRTSIEHLVAPKIFYFEEQESRLTENSLKRLSAEFNDSHKVMVLLGQEGGGIPYEQELIRFSQFEKVTVLTESTSNIHHPNFVENIDRCITGLSDSEAEEYMPDLLITLGGAVVSKRIKSLIRKFRPRAHWNVHEFDVYVDTYQSLTSSVSLKAGIFFSQLLEIIKDSSSDYAIKWSKLKQIKEERHDSFISTCPYSDLKVFDHIYKGLPDNFHLHISNSSPIRYAQLFNNKSISYTWCNRGTSGIDGCTSTAMGAASASKNKNFLLITGDVAFNYDINALWNIQEINNLRIIVINNSGGGVFRIIPGPGSIGEMTEFQETSTVSNASEIAKHFKWAYLSSDDLDSLDVAVKEFFERKKGRIILEIFTDADINPVVLENYWKHLK